MKFTNFGITGTRFAITDYQAESIKLYLSTMSDLVIKGLGLELTLHHGDCVGADVAVARIAKDLGFRIVSHPPIKDELRAFFDGNDQEMNSENYLKRNRNLVDAVEFLIVVPRTMYHEPRGGTWYTHDYAKKQGTEVRIFWPEATNVPMGLDILFD
jgi:hypothetical protein